MFQCSAMFSCSVHNCIEYLQHILKQCDSHRVLEFNLAQLIAGTWFSIPLCQWKKAGFKMSELFYTLRITERWLGLWLISLFFFFFKYEEVVKLLDVTVVLYVILHWNMRMDIWSSFQIRRFHFTRLTLSACDQCFTILKFNTSPAIIPLQ